MEGLQQAYQGEPLAIKKDRIEQILQQHDAKAQAEAQAPQSEAALEAEHRFHGQEKAKTRRDRTGRRHPDD